MKVNKMDILIMLLLTITAAFAILVFTNSMDERKQVNEEQSYIKMEVADDTETSDSTNIENKDVNEGVNTDTNIDIEESADVVTDEVDENGVPVEDSTYLDSDGDTVPNANDVCDGLDDFSSDCEA